MSSSRRDVGRFDSWASSYDRSYLQRLRQDGVVSVGTHASVSNQATPGKGSR
jgi:hypothetical protein